MKTPSFGRSGLTLLEVMIASAILAALVTVAYLFLAAAPASYGDSMRISSLQSAARGCVDELTAELRLADASLLTVLPYRGADRVEFRIPRKVDDAGTTWSPLIEYRWEPGAPGPSKSGGLETGRLVRSEGGSLRTLSYDVAPGGIKFKRTGDSVAIGLLLRSADSKGRPFECSVETSVALRNRSLGR